MLEVGSAPIGFVGGWLIAILGRGSVRSFPALAWGVCLTVAFFFSFPGGIWAFLIGLVAGALAQMFFAEESAGRPPE